MFSFGVACPDHHFFDEKPRNCEPFLAKKPKSAPPQITRAFLLMFSYGVAHADYHFLIAEPPTLKSKQTLIWRQNLSIFWPQPKPLAARSGLPEGVAGDKPKFLSCKGNSLFGAADPISTKGPI